MRIRISRSVVPNLFTVLNIFFGFLCILHVHIGRFEAAAWYIVASALCDTLDGFIARLTHSASEFGVELDSLADVIGFGVAPAYLVYVLFLQNFGTVGILIAAMPLIFGALRLARFNVQLTGFSKEHFIGLPIPLSALLIASFVFFFSPENIQTSQTLQYVFGGMVFAASLLMVSTIVYPVLPRFSRRSFKDNPVVMSLYIVAALLILVTLGKGLFPVLSALALIGIVFDLQKRISRLLNSAHHSPDEEETADPVSLDS